MGKLRKIIKKLRKNPNVGFFIGIIARVSKYLIFISPKNAEVLSLIRQIQKERGVAMLADYEAYQLYREVKRTGGIKGDLAEVGAYSGGSTKLICEAKQGRSLHVFDTFEGLPELSSVDNPSQFHQGQYVAQYEDVKRYLVQYPNVYIYKGLFPDTAEPMKNLHFSFVHLDVDLYMSTLNCLKFFYPRMNKGGVIVSHDYCDDVPGVKLAFDEFFKDKPERVKELFGTQCMIVKL